MHCCVLCGHTNVVTIHPQNDKRHYFWCQNCQLIFADARFYPSFEAEKNRYDRHQYCAGDPGHVAFLEQLLNPMMKYLTPGMRGLDYGCGPRPVVSGWLQQRGLPCDNYDPFYGIACASDSYDYIVSTEVVEHFKNPLDEWNKMIRLLKSGGFLMIMTERWKCIEGFESWHYKTDATHVSFYHVETFAHIARICGLSIEEHDEKRVVIMKKM